MEDIPVAQLMKCGGQELPRVEMSSRRKTLGHQRSSGFADSLRDRPNTKPCELVFDIGQRSGLEERATNSPSLCVDQACVKPFADTNAYQICSRTISFQRRFVFPGHVLDYVTTSERACSSCLHVGKIQGRYAHPWMVF